MMRIQDSTGCFNDGTCMCSKCQGLRSINPTTIIKINDPLRPWEKIAKVREAQKIVDKWGDSNGRPDWQCHSCEWWDNSPWQIEPETRLCLYPEKRANAKSWGFVEACGPEFGCVHWIKK